MIMDIYPQRLNFFYNLSFILAVRLVAVLITSDHRIVGPLNLVCSFSELQLFVAICSPYPLPPHPPAPPPLPPQFLELFLTLIYNSLSLGEWYIFWKDLYFFSSVTTCPMPQDLDFFSVATCPWPQDLENFLNFFLFATCPRPQDLENFFDFFFQLLLAQGPRT